MARYLAAHLSPQGPGDERPTADEIIADEGLQGELTGHVIFLTGCSSGLGVEAAKALYKTGATLYLTARNISKAQDALGVEVCHSPRVHLLFLDLGSLASVRTCAASLRDREKRLDIFIANAGIMACPEGRTDDGFEKQLGTNHLGHFLLFNLLKPMMLYISRYAHSARAVIVSSGAHRFAELEFTNHNLVKEYSPWRAYGQSKTANIWMANSIDRQEKGNGIRGFSVHPGIIDTGLGQYLSDTERKKMLADQNLLHQLKSPGQGAATIAYAAISQGLNNSGGKYLEDCHIASPFQSSGDTYAPGYAEWAYNPGKEKLCWELSAQLVGI